MSLGIFVVLRSDYAPEKYSGEMYFFNESMTAIEAENHEIKYKNPKRHSRSQNDCYRYNYSLPLHCVSLLYSFCTAV